MITGIYLDIDKETKRITSPSIRFGKLPRLILLGKKYAIVRQPGEQVCDTGKVTYIPTTWYLLEIEQESNNRFKVVKIVLEEEPGMKWRKCYSHMCQQLVDLETA